MMSKPDSASKFDTVDFPVAIPPVNPMQEKYVPKYTDAMWMTPKMNWNQKGVCFVKVFIRM